MRSGILFLAALLSVAAAPEGQRFDAAAAFRSVLPAEQARSLSGQDDLATLASALSPEQRVAAGSKLREAERQTRDPRDLSAIHKGYLALKDADGAGRVGDAMVERYPQASAGYVMRGQAAELRGDMSGAVEQAQEALRRDPRDKAAFALLKLSEGRANTSGSAAPAPSSDASFASDFNAAPRAGASPVALDLMRQAVEARRSNDMERVHSLALAAMKADPRSDTVQRFYRLTAEDRARQQSAAVGLYAELRRRDLDARAERSAAADLAAARRKHAPRAPPIPPIAPIGAGGLLLTLGIMAWNRGLRDEAERRAHEAARVAAAGLIVLGCAGISYGAATLLLAATPTAGPPALALAGGGAAASAAPAAAPVAAGVAGAAVGAKALEQYSFASAPAHPSDSDESLNGEARGGRGAFEEARAGGKHAGFLREYATKKPGELRSAEKSFEGLIELHKDKINNPTRYAPNWDKMSLQAQEGQLRHWFNQIERQMEQRDIVRGIMKERGL